MIPVQDIMHAVFLRSPNNLFDEFISECQKWYENPAHSLSEMRMRDNKKLRGDMFEEFSLLYLKYVKGYKNVWLLKDVPDDVLDKLTMKRKDMGIDLIIETDDKTYMAVQCKYKKHIGTKQNILSWSALSTFYALCLRTGPWEKYIVMTNCVYTRHQGKKTKQDVSYCLKTLQNITKDEWLLMCDIHGQKVGTIDSNICVEPQQIINVPVVNVVKAKKPKAKAPLSNLELREIRYAYYAPK
jgi:predicted helicase